MRDGPSVHDCASMARMTSGGAGRGSSSEKTAEPTDVAVANHGDEVSWASAR